MAAAEDITCQDPKGRCLNTNRREKQGAEVGRKKRPMG